MRKKILLAIAILLSLAYLAEATSFKNNIIRYVYRQRNKIPRRYIEPTDTQIALFREAVDNILDSDFASAQSAAGAVGYRLKLITHTNGLTYYILESTDPDFRPWGTYVFYLGSDRGNFVIEAPHPYEEKNTTKIGIMAFESTGSETKATAFLMAGSRKGTGDVTLLAESFFQAAHEITAPDTTTVVFQIHGFNRRKLPQIILTSGTPIAISAMDNLVDELIQNGFEVGIYNGTLYADYGATQNEQARFTNSIGGSFIGVFLNQIVHHSKSKNALVIDAIEDTISESLSTET